MPHKKIIQDRLEFLEIDTNTSLYLDKLQELLIPAIDNMLDRMYEQILAVPELQALFPDESTIKAAREAQKKHWLSVLFSKDFGKNSGKFYFDNAERIGTTHERIGLTLGWYVNVYCLMINKFVRLAADHFSGDAVELTQMVQAINKAVFLDMNFVIDSYLKAKDKSMKYLLIEAELFTSERKKMDETLAKDANGLQSCLESIRKQIESLVKETESLNNQLNDAENRFGAGDAQLKAALNQTKRTGLELKNEIQEAYSPIQQAINDSAALAERISTLKEEFEQLQHKHKLHYFPSENDSLYEKLKSFLTSTLR